MCAVSACLVFLLLNLRSGTFSRGQIYYGRLRHWKSRGRSRRKRKRVGMFTPVETSIGAILLHQATSNLLYQNGNILGASGFLRQLFTAPTEETVAFFVGMAASYLPLKTFAPQLLTSYPSAPMTLLATLATISVGALIGLGTKVCLSIEDASKIPWS